MKANKSMGIWMDHSSADIIDLKKENKNTITSKFTADIKEDALGRSENLMHNKRQQMLEAYYKEIATKILSYDHVVLFGPTNAKTELYNYLNKDAHFKDVKIDVKSADKLTDNEKKAFVRDYFDN
jgi:stalled ribosome rescue protein Dom34